MSQDGHASFCQEITEYLPLSCPVTIGYYDQQSTIFTYWMEVGASRFTSASYTHEGETGIQKQDVMSGLVSCTERRSWSH